MKYLLDTHTFIWLNGAPAHLSSRAEEICADESNILLLSLASIWEMQIKLQLGKLRLPADLAEIVTRQQEINHIELLPITVQHIVGLANLPNYHKDPFDRLIISQAMVESAMLLSDDSQVARYPIETIW